MLGLGNHTLGLTFSTPGLVSLVIVVFDNFVNILNKKIFIHEYLSILAFMVLGKDTEESSAP